MRGIGRVILLRQRLAVMRCPRGLQINGAASVQFACSRGSTTSHSLVQGEMEAARFRRSLHLLGDRNLVHHWQRAVCIPEVHLDLLHGIRFSGLFVRGQRHPAPVMRDVRPVPADRHLRYDERVARLVFLHLHFDTIDGRLLLTVRLRIPVIAVACRAAVLLVQRVGICAGRLIGELHEIGSGRGPRRRLCVAGGGVGKARNLFTADQAVDLARREGRVHRPSDSRLRNALQCGRKRRIPHRRHSLRPAQRLADADGEGNGLQSLLCICIGKRTDPVDTLVLAVRFRIERSLIPLRVDLHNCCRQLSLVIGGDVDADREGLRVVGDAFRPAVHLRDLIDGVSFAAEGDRLERSRSLRRALFRVRGQFRSLHGQRRLDRLRVPTIRGLPIGVLRAGCLSVCSFTGSSVRSVSGCRSGLLQREPERLIRSRRLTSLPAENLSHAERDAGLPVIAVRIDPGLVHEPQRGARGHVPGREQHPR